MNCKHLKQWLLPIVFCTSIAATLSRSVTGNEVDFERDVAPILEEHCWHCHGADEQESDLRLDVRQHLLRGGSSGIPAIVLGRPEKSFLIEVVSHDHDELKMPPDSERLPDQQIDILRTWIAQGAVWPGQMAATEAGATTQHWAFQPVKRPSVPNLQASASPIDSFLVRKLKRVGLGFSSPAEPRSLLRRVSIVLTGLPPTPLETSDFLTAYALDSEHAYRELVERLLDSPHFGERWAQHWLDVIRWAETNGSEANLYRKRAWVYRDYVVDAFNSDKPYDRFLREQIAGDSLNAGEATGFLVAGPHVPAATVGRQPAAIRQARADRMDEIMQTVGASVMAVTVGCARCHNHKFDPITISDYYSMTAVFQDVEFGGRFAELPLDHPRRKRGDALLETISKQRENLRQYGGWEESWGAYREVHFNPVSTQAIRVRFKTPNVSLDEFEVLGVVGDDTNLAAARNGTRVTGFPAAGNERRNPIENVNDGNYGTMAWRAQTPKDGKERPWLRYDFPTDVEISRLRLSNNREYYYDTTYLEQMPKLAKYQFDLDILADDGSWKSWIGTWRINQKLNQEHPRRATLLTQHQQLIETFLADGPQASFVGRFVPPATTHVLLRGSPESPRDEVPPAGPVILNGDLSLSSETEGAVRRREFAEWISAPSHPLTPRVMVNRLWHHVFGTGIVSTTSDFGTAGALPSHPDLLDWLAAEFVDPTVSTDDDPEPPWSIKRIIRMMVLSRAFRQSSIPNPEGHRIDAGATLLWRFPPKRVEAEVIRDAVLQASGKLDRTIGGQSYRIHNVKKTYAQWKVLDNHGPGTWRRMLYQERMRRVDDGMFTAFDFPDCGQVRAKRPVSTTPLQALNLMNSDFILEQAKLIADRAEHEAEGEREAAIDGCFQLILGRHATGEEVETCTAIAAESGLAVVCRALINSNEFAFLP